jgi:hypothetical protein
MSYVQRGFDILTLKNDNMLPQNTGIWLPSDAASYPKRTESSNVGYTSNHIISYHISYHLFSFYGSIQLDIYTDINLLSENIGAVY